jgi:DNA-binding transcriptional ArsR family regulator
VSKHLSLLRAARLVESRKEGRWMYYRLPEKFRAPSAGKILALLFDDLDRTDRIAEDRKRLTTIGEERMESLCRRLFCKT